MRRLPTSGAILVTAAGLLALVASVLASVAPVVASASAAPRDGEQAAHTQIGEATDDTDPPAEAPVPAADPAEGTASDAGVLEVVKVEGLLDPILVDFVIGSIDDAVAAGSVGIVLQVDSPGAVVDDVTLARLVAAMRDAPIPVSVWVGPSGGATGAAAVLGGHAAAFGMAGRTSWGLLDAAVPSQLLEDTLREVPVRRMSAEEAEDQGLTTVDAPTLGIFIVNLPEVVSEEVADLEGRPTLQPITQVRFAQLPLLGQLLHTAASPAVAYLLLTVGLVLLVFELYTAGVGVAGVVGAGSLLLGSYGLGALPLRFWALLLIGLAMVAFAVDVQTGVPRAWTAIGMGAYVVGSLFLYDGVSMSWITLAVAFAGVALTFTSGMPSMVRTRFATPTIGREWMVGELGRAITDVDPDGVVQIREAKWRATTNRATPIEQLERIRVVGIDGLVLEVEPEVGGARDYRDRGGTSSE
ncbi:MAG: hypothetical protein JJU45_15405 [Acidimicrobiia bacterium]|nr:hypothetical protein [Acidimicrobiia bacterium]